MIDILMNSFVAYYINVDAINMVGVATDTFFQEKLNTSFQIQISDIDIEFNMNNANFAGGIVPLDIGGVALTTELKQNFIKSGCPDSLFRQMTVEGKPNLLHQLVAPGCFRLLNQELPSAPGSTVYRGVLKNINIKIQSINDLPIGCLEGREDYQEIFLSSSFMKKICQASDISKWTIQMPFYDDIWLSIINKKWDTLVIDDNRFEDDNYLNILRADELFALLEFAVHNKNKLVGDKVYNHLKTRSLPMARLRGRS